MLPITFTVVELLSLYEILLELNVGLPFTIVIVLSKYEADNSDDPLIQQIVNLTANVLLDLHKFLSVFLSLSLRLKVQLVALLSRVLVINCELPPASIFAFNEK